MVTDADGTTRVGTLAQAGVTAIDSTENSVTRSVSDGARVDGETISTTSDGSTTVDNQASGKGPTPSRLPRRR